MLEPEHRLFSIPGRTHNVKFLSGCLQYGAYRVTVVLSSHTVVSVVFNIGDGAGVGSAGLVSVGCFVGRTVGEMVGFLL
jgi:hypothetical protein